MEVLIDAVPPMDMLKAEHAAMFLTSQAPEACVKFMRIHVVSISQSRSLVTADQVLLEHDRAMSIVG
jgi:hypothetical protein